MKKILIAFFSVSLILSSAVLSSSLPNDNSFSVAAAQQTTVKRKRNPGIIRSTYRGGRWVVRRTWDGTKWVSKRVWVAAKWTGKTTWKTGRKVVSRTKKIVY